jgi:hypothetical protein
VREGDISSYHDALMRCLLFPHREGAKGVGSERFRAGEIVSHAMGEEEQWGIVFRDFIRQSVQEWSGMERDEGQQRRGICHGMTSGEWSKPLLRPPAQENQLSCMEQDRVGLDGTQNGSVGQAEPRADA